MARSFRTSNGVQEVQKGEQTFQEGSAETENKDTQRMATLMPVTTTKVQQDGTAWGGLFIHPIAVCEECREIIEGRPYIVLPDMKHLEFRHHHRLAFLDLRKDGKDGKRGYEVEGASPALQKILRWVGEYWERQATIADVQRYLRLMLIEEL